MSGSNAAAVVASATALLSASPAGDADRVDTDADTGAAVGAVADGIPYLVPSAPPTPPSQSPTHSCCTAWTSLTSTDDASEDTDASSTLLSVTSSSWRHTT